MENRSHFEKPQVFAVKHKSDSERMNSQSGGAFALLSDLIIEQGGIVYGCVFDEQFRAIHVRADNISDRNRMRFSKYVQSNMGDVYKSVLKDLEEGRTVLFSGTSCQVAGITKYLELLPGKIKGQIYTVDIICHGVPSPRVWKDFLKWEEDKNKSKIENVICRNKEKFGWKSHVVTTAFKNGRKYDSRVFPKIFYSHVALRPGCYKCPYKSIIHPSDITIADYWGIDNALPGFKDDKGVSLVLVNSSEGAELFRGCKDQMVYKETRIEDSMQKPLIEPYDPPINRNAFWEDYEILSFDEIARKYGNYSLFKDFKWKAKAFLKRRVLKRI